MRTWITDRDMAKYQNAVTHAFGMHLVWNDVTLDKMKNEDYKKAVLECYRKALDEVPMPAETP